MSIVRTDPDSVVVLPRGMQSGPDRVVPYALLDAGAPARAEKDPARPSAAVGPAGYRLEIDGLRAVAVWLVVFYHAEVRIAGLDAFAGGFVGVDVFFVISGYLIASILEREVAAGTFSFATFYERRARRILPALYLVLAVSVPLSWAFLLPSAAKDWSFSLLATVLSVSNVYFWHSGSYDTADNLVRPLIHTWSLGVEEQFYLLFPVMLVMVRRSACRYWLPVLCLVCALSLGFAQWLTGQAPSASFFLLPSRIWELGLGAILAHREIRHGRAVSKCAARIMPAVGIALLVIATVIMRPQWHHPGLLTLLPVTGAALLIRYSGSGDAVTRLLSSRPFVFSGLVSYSFYLWHQPVLAFGRASATGAIGGGRIAAWIFLSFLLGAATYVFVERPTRNRSRTSRRFIVCLATLGAVSLGGIAGSGYVTNGAMGRFEGALAPIAAASLVRESEITQAGTSCLNFVAGQPPCVFAGPDPGGYALVSLGDSHARTLTGPLRDGVAGRPGFATFSPINRGGCVFLLAMHRVDEDQPSCPDAYNDERLAEVARLQRPVAVLLSRLPLLVERSRYDNGEGGVEPGADHPYLAVAGETRPAEPAAVAAALSRTVRALLEHGVKVVLVYPVPEMGWNVPQVLLARARAGGDPASMMEDEPISVSYGDFRQRTRRTYELYDSLGEAPDLLRVYPEAVLCDGRRCYANEGARIFYRDDNHLSLAGAQAVSDAVLDAIARRWPR